MNIHLAVYDQKNAGIVSAALDLLPEKVILLHRKKHDVKGMKAVLKGRGIKCENKMVSFDPIQIRTIVGAILDENTDNNLILNASSGYRMMVLVTLELFTSSSKKAFVVDKFTNEIHWINPSSQPSKTIKTTLKIHEYVKLFSARTLNKGLSNKEPQSRQALTSWLIKNIVELSGDLSTLNYMAAKAEHSLTYQLDYRQQTNTTLNTVLKKFEEIRVLEIKNDSIYFNDEENRFYANGGWLEHHLFSLINRIKNKRKNISDVTRGLELEKPSGNVKNEIDVIAMINNRLHLFECKTRKFTKHKDANTPGAAAVYRLDTLMESFGGHSGKAMLVSYQKLSQYTEQRAKDLGIYCCSFLQLKQLEHHLYKFIDSKE